MTSVHWHPLISMHPPTRTPHTPGPCQPTGGVGPVSPAHPFDVEAAGLLHESQYLKSGCPLVFTKNQGTLTLLVMLETSSWLELQIGFANGAKERCRDNQPFLTVHKIAAWNPCRVGNVGQQCKHSIEKKMPIHFLFLLCQARSDLYTKHNIRVGCLGHLQSHAAPDRVGDGGEAVEGHVELLPMRKRERGK